MPHDAEVQSCSQFAKLCEENLQRRWKNLHDLPQAINRAWHMQALGIAQTRPQTNQQAAQTAARARPRAKTLSERIE